MVDWQLMRCSVGKHKMSDPIDDSILGWVRICKRCGHIIKIPKPDMFPNIRHLEDEC